MPGGSPVPVTLPFTVQLPARVPEAGVSGPAQGASFEALFFLSPFLSLSFLVLCEPSPLPFESPGQGWWVPWRAGLTGGNLVPLGALCSAPVHLNANG